MYLSKKVLLLVLGVVIFSGIIYYNKSGLPPFGKESTTISSESEITQLIDLGNGVEMEFVRIEPGSFIMGTLPEMGDEDESPVHKVIITKPFYLSKYEVTQEQWEAVMGNNPSKFKDRNRPVESVSWEDCQKFFDKFYEITGTKSVLPSEAQWEYACRAGTTTLWSFGDEDTLLEDYAWVVSNSAGETHPVGEKKPNPWGIYDMYGNVQEWCSDWYANSYTDGNVADPVGISSGDSRVLRGGAWGDYPANARSAYRNCTGPDTGHEGIGLRCMIPADDIYLEDVK